MGALLEPACEGAAAGVEECSAAGSESRARRGKAKGGVRRGLASAV